MTARLKNDINLSQTWAQIATLLWGVGRLRRRRFRYGIRDAYRARPVTGKAAACHDDRSPARIHFKGLI